MVGLISQAHQLGGVVLLSLTWVYACRVISAEQQSLKQQAQMMSEADVVIMTHGAAMGNIMFMAPVSSIPPYLRLSFPYNLDAPDILSRNFDSRTWDPCLDPCHACRRLILCPALRGLQHQKMGKS